MPLIEETSYQAPFLVANKHLATIIPMVIRRPKGVSYERERLTLPDGDFVDVDWSTTGSHKLVIFSHGLVGNSGTPYVVGMVKYFNKLGWDALAWNFRSCSGEPNLKHHFYHPGQTDDLHTIIHHALAKHGYESIALIGFSLGGVFTLRYLGERANEVPPQVKRAVTFSVPVDLGACSYQLGIGPNAFYGNIFLNKYKQKIIDKEARNPGTQNLEHWENIKVMRDFDFYYNTSWYGFSDLEEFYFHASAHYVLHQIQVPALIVNAENDPFLPETCYPVEMAEKNKNIFLEIPRSGGHVGFMTFKWKGVYWSEARAAAFLEGL